ncbi:MAG TPA: sulfatase-like hydrolase/transferase [Methylomirabilota bacterium]
MKHDPWIRLGLLGTGLIASTLFIHVPVEVWAGNVAEFHSPAVPLLTSALGAAAAALAIAAAVLLVIPRGARPLVAALAAAIGVVAWVYAFPLAADMTALTGREAPANLETPLGVWELPVVAVAVVLLALVLVRIPAAAIAGLLVLHVGLGLITTVRAGSARQVSASRARADSSGSTSPFRFAPAGNVLVVVMDGLQADVAGELLRQDPGLRSAFDGFLFFPDALGVAPTTFLSVPAVHAGRVYRGPGPMARYFTESIERHSFMNRFARAGYATTLVNPVEGVCPSLVATCAAAAGFLRTPGAQLRLEWPRLLDLSLFRASPAWLKARIYAGGQWLLSSRVETPHEIGQVLDGIRIFHEIARRATVAPGAPALTFVHSLATHTPYVLAEDCRTLLPTSLALRWSQSRCALLAVGALLEWLKAEGVYDDSLVLLVADHGMNPGIFADGPGGRVAWRHLAGSANPAFLLKPFGSRGPLQKSPAPVYLPDVGATLCAATGACRAPVGFPAGEAPSGRRRLFAYYEWKHEYWSAGEIPRLTRYEVRGPLAQAGSWRRLD